METKLYYQPSTDQLIVHRTQDVEPILDANKAEFNSAPETGRFKGEFHRVASIPNVVIEQWLKEGINFYDKAHWPAVRRKLNSPEYAYLRTKPGRI